MASINAHLVPWKKEHTPGLVIGLHTTPPKIIYRFLTMGRAEEAITSSKLYFSTAPQFNDPFDLNPALLDFSMTKEELTRFVYTSAHPLMSKEYKDGAIAFFEANPAELISTQKAKFEYRRNKQGICCFSGIVANNVMWGNYADKSTGMALGFNIEPFPVSEFGLLIQPVNYSTNVKPIRVNGTDGREAIRHWLTTKTSEWSYEKEFRAMYQHRHGLVDFDKNCLKEVYFGYQVQDQKVNQIIDFMKSKNYHDVKCFRMTLNHATFEMEPRVLETII